MLKLGGEETAKLPPPAPDAPSRVSARERRAARRARYGWDDDDDAADVDRPQPAEKRPKPRAAAARARPSAASAAAADEESGGGDGGGGDGGDSSDEEGAHLAVGDNHTVKIAAGPHAGKEAKVLHVGNGWVKLQLPSSGGGHSGAVVHLRKWDLDGEIPLKMRSPAKAGGGGGGSKDGGGASSAGASPRVKDAKKGDEAMASPMDPEAEAKRLAEEKRLAEQADDRRRRAEERKHKPWRDKAPKRELSAEEKAARAKAKEEQAAKEAAAEERKRKRMEEALGPGFEVGAAVWARWSGIKFSHGTIERLLSSSKWVLVKLDTDAGGGGEAKSQWVTARDLVLDTPPPPATRHPEAGIIEDGTLVIAAFPNESDYYKGRIVGLTKTTGRHAEGVRYRVQYDDWDDATVDHENVRVLPPDFGAKKKKPEKRRRRPTATLGRRLRRARRRRAGDAAAARLPLATPPPARRLRRADGGGLLRPPPTRPPPRPPPRLLCRARRRARARRRGASAAKDASEWLLTGLV